MDGVTGARGMQPADRDDVEAAADGIVAGEVTLPDGSDLPVTLDADLVEQAQQHGVDPARLSAAAVPSSATVDLSAQTDTDTTSTVPVQDRRETDLTSRFRRQNRFRYIQDDQIQRLLSNGINYTERVGHFLLERDDLIPTVKERLKALIVGEDGIEPTPSDPDSEADQRLTDHLETLYGEDIRPTEVIDAILRENMMNARAVLRATDLAELDLKDLDYLRDGISGEEIYVQDRTTVYTFDIQEPAVDEDDDAPGDVIPGIDLEQETVDPQPLVIGDHVFDISLYDTPPLEAVADTAVNKMVMQRLKARKAEITSFGAVYASIEPPSYLPENQYFDRVQDDDWDGEGQPPTKLERAFQQNIQNAFDTLKDFQSGTVMAVPDFWNLQQLEIPETGDPLDDQIRGYNRDIARRLLVPLDLIELQSGSELSRETMFQTLMTTIAGWRREIKRVFDAFAEAQADIEGIGGEVEHSFPPLKDANAKQVISALQYAGVAGLSQKEVRQMLNTVQGVDLDTDMDDDMMPEEGGPSDPGEREDQMRELLEDQRRGGESTPEPPEPPQPGQQGAQDGAQQDAAAAVTDTLRATGADAQQATDDADGDVDFQLDFPVSRRPNLSSRVTVETTRSVTGGRLALPPVPKRDISADTLQARINEMLDDITDGDMPLDARVADREPDYQPFVDIQGGLPVDLLERIADELPRAYNTMLDSMEAAQASAGGSGNGQPDGSGGSQMAGADGPTGTAADILRSVPFLPDPDGDGPVRIRDGALRSWLAWVRADRPSLEAFNPSVHPRGPDGRFIDRPYDIPDEVASDIDDLSTPDVLDRLVREGELSDGDLDALLQDDGVVIDGVPDDATTRTDLQDASAPADGDTSDAVADMAERGWVSDSDAPDLRRDTADSVEGLDEAGENTGSAAQNMSVARWGGRKAYLKEYRTDPDGPRSDGEKPTNAEREVAADTMLRNMGFGESMPSQFWDEEENYIAAENIDGTLGRQFSMSGDTPEGAVDREQARELLPALLLAGNSDMHGDNFVVQDDGTVSPIDLNKSGGDFTEASKFRERGISMLTNVSRRFDLGMSQEDIVAAAEDMAQDMDVEAVLDGVEDSDVSDAARHQFRQNIRRNIEAFAAGEVDL